jgi:hypothetical protein
MNWWRQMKKWWIGDRATSATRAAASTLRDIDEQRLLEEVWRRIEEAGKGYTHDRPLRQHRTPHDA